MKWEYEIVRPGYNDVVITVLNEYGIRGWELVSVTDPETLPILYFKRPKQGE